MYEYIENPDSVKVVGSFNYDRNRDFKDSVKHLFEGFQSSYQMDPITDISKILKIDTLKEAYKEMLLEDVSSQRFDDEYYAMMPDKLEQLFENSALDMLEESGVATLAPIVGITLPILKKAYIEGHAKDIVMTEVPTKPIIKAAYERRFLKDANGNKYYIPDVFYDDKYREIMGKGKGTPVPSTFYDVPLPNGELNILDEVTAITGKPHSITQRDSLAYDFGIDTVLVDVDGAGTLKPVKVNIQPNMAADSTFSARIKTEDAAGLPVEDELFGRVDFYTSTVSVASATGKVKKVRFCGHLNNENNWNTIEVDRERELMEWKIPDGVRINTGLTLEKIKDYKALFDFDITTEIISDISTVLAQYEDSEILRFLEDSYDNWLGRGDLPFGYDGYNTSFVETGYFKCEPPANKYVTRSQWIATELKYDLNRFIDELKVKLRHQDIMFVVYGHPNNITLIQDDVRWVIDEDTKVGGIQLDYRFGVMTANKNRIHVISSMKAKKERGLRVVAYPLSKEIITFKHYKYSMNIENAYRNPFTPLTPNVMGTSRFLTTEVLPIQGEFHILENQFSLKDPGQVATAVCAAPVFSMTSGSYELGVGETGKSLVLSCVTPGAKIYYTTDGSEPTVEAGTEYTGVIEVSKSATYKAKAFKRDATGNDLMQPSATITAEYTIA